jgi:signal peptidase I
MQPPILSADLPKPATSRSAARLIKFLIYSGAVVAFLLAYFVAKFFLWARCFDLHAFRVPSASMCPAICEDERVIAGMDAFNARIPQRGEIILFERGEDNTRFIKRVIAVAGDTIAPGPSNAIFVNNKPLILPPPCGENNVYARLAGEGQPFQTVKVPAGSLFVIGDNLDNSYDSRHFGLVTLDKVKGKALLIYWSPNTSRIGCKLN